MPDCYDVHGVTFTIDCHDGDVSAAVASRLRTFAEPRPALTPSTAEVAVTIRAAAGPVEPVGVEAHRKVVLDRPRVKAWWEPESDVLIVETVTGAGARVRFGAGKADFWFDPGDPLSRRAASHPLLTLTLSECLKRHGIYDVHAGGVARDGAAIVLPAGSGSGKTTLTLALVEAGWDFLSDDLILLRDEATSLVALPFPDEVDVTEHTAVLLPWLRPVLASARPDQWPKWPVRLEDVWPVRVATQATPQLVLLPRVTGLEETTTVRVGPAVALEQLLRNVLLTDERSTRRHVGALSRLATTVPVFHVLTGTRLDAAVDAIDDLLSAG